MRLRLVLTALFLLLLPLSSFSSASRTEQILDFIATSHSSPTAPFSSAKPSSSNSTGAQIRHGIYRDFPTRYKDRLGNNYIVGFQLLSAECDGYSETSRLEDQLNGKRIYLGNPKFYISSGRHTYVISYSTNRQLGFFADHDEMYWNVTGNGWIFPIDHASATVTVPQNIAASDLSFDGFSEPPAARSIAAQPFRHR
jgi:Predicted membrane protein (DUF2207)